MDKKLKTKWLKALRSGKYKQARGRLIDDEGAMCCIGVLGDLCGMTRSFMLNNASSIAGTGFEKIESALDRDVVDKLADMNDGSERKGIKKKSFLQIANYIEKNL